ncbi:hypothetical protein [Congregibacter sp.]|uniref:hypothetical protein n=1 Tax=Congregibacter sp. TaxID=2744308 RepID=UPI003F6C59BD
MNKAMAAELVRHDIAADPVEAIVEPNSAGNDVEWETVSFLGVHRPILPILLT